MRGLVSVDLLERSHLGLRGQRAPEPVPVSGDQAVAETEWPREKPRHLRERRTSWQQIEERGYRRATRVHLSVGRHEVGRVIPALGLHSSQELLGLSVLPGDRSQAEPAVEVEEAGHGPQTESAVAVVDNSCAIAVLGKP